MFFNTLKMSHVKFRIDVQKKYKTNMVDRPNILYQINGIRYLVRKLYIKYFKAYN